MRNSNRVVTRRCCWRRSGTSISIRARAWSKVTSAAYVRGSNHGFENRRHSDGTRDRVQAACHRISVLSPDKRSLSGPSGSSRISRCAAPCLPLGAPVGSGHVAVSIAIAAAWSGLHLWRNAAAPGSSRRTLALLLLAACLLALVVRSGVIELLTQIQGWSAYAAVVPAAIVTGVVLQRVGTTGAHVHFRALLVALVGYAFFLRVLYCAQIELLPEEAYYWNYSRHLDIGYLDHPPMVAWLVRLGTLLFGDTEFGVLFGALCCGTVSSFFNL